MFASDPKIDPKGKKAFEDMSVLAFAFDSMGTNPTYSFVPVPPEDAKDDAKPMELAGKMYESYLPPVIELKTTFAPVAHPSSNQMTPDGSTRPLCVEDGRLMFIGVKVIPGAVPPPVDNPVENFGLTPYHRQDGDGFDDENDCYKTFEAFLAALKQAKVEVFDSGQNDFVYFALCRVRPNYFVFVQESRPGKEDFTYTAQVTDASHAQLKAEKKQITLVEDPPGDEGQPAPVIQGDVYQLPAGYEGQVSVLGTYGDSTDKPDSRVSFFKTVRWK
jgi:hypothetical protein